MSVKNDEAEALRLAADLTALLAGYPMYIAGSALSIAAARLIWDEGRGGKLMPHGIAVFAASTELFIESLKKGDLK